MGIVEWKGEPSAGGDEGKLHITAVDAWLGGAVTLSDGSGFINPAKHVDLRRYVTFHIVHHRPGTQYPINMLRNLAWSLAPTDLVFLSDVDFMPSPGMAAHVKHQCDLLDVVQRRLVLVVPSF